MKTGPRQNKNPGYEDGINVEEVAQKLKWSQGNIRGRVNRGPLDYQVPDFRNFLAGRL